MDVLKDNVLSEKDKEDVLLSIKTIYSQASIPVIFCDSSLSKVWENEKAKEMLKKINLDLVLSQENFNDVKLLIENQEAGSIDSCFLPFLGCKISVMPVKYNSFLGAILSFEAVDDFYRENLFKKTDQVVSILSSNLRLPMHIITNAIGMLNDDIESSGNSGENRNLQLKKSISVIENNTYKMFRVCQNLSELIRFSTESNQFKKSFIKIRNYMNELIDLCCEYIERSDHRVVYNFSVESDGASWMNIDCEKFEMAIANILLNSCQYSPPSTTIFIDINVGPDQMNISIRDEGYGIPEDKLKEVFRPYTTLKHKQIVSTGIGIGLTLAKYIIEQHGGAITLKSKEGEGTQVDIMLPIDQTLGDKVIQMRSNIIYSSSVSVLVVQFSPLSY